MTMELTHDMEIYLGKMLNHPKLSKEIAWHTEQLSGTETQNEYLTEQITKLLAERAEVEKQLDDIDARIKACKLSKDYNDDNIATYTQNLAMFERWNSLASQYKDKEI